MEVNHHSTDHAPSGSYVGNILIGALSKLSPSDITKSKVLEACFREFFGRGTAEDCWQLIPQVHKSVIFDRCRLASLSSAPSKPPVSNSVDDILSSKGPSSCGASRGSPISSVVSSNTPVSNPPLSCCTSSNITTPITTPPGAELTQGPLIFIAQLQPTADTSLSNSESLVASYFEKIIPGANPDRIQRLVRIVRGFVEAKALSSESYETLWSPKGGIFEGSEHGLKRFCRLQRGRRKIMQGTAEYDCADRLALIFVNHDVDHLSHAPKNSKDLKLRRGQNRKTAAFERLAEVSNTPLESLKNDCSRSRNYLHLLVQAGPGSLLEIGSNVSSNWEVKMNKDDIKLVLQYRETQLPELEKRAISLNGVAARTIVYGLLAYGWSFPELLSSRSFLMEEVKKYLDIKQLTDDMQMQCGVSTTQYSEANIDDADWSSKKRRSDSVDGKDAKRRRTSSCPRKSHMSNPTSLSSGEKTIETRLPLGHIGIENQCLRSCSPISTGLNPPREVIFNEFRQAAMTKASAADILDGATPSIAMSQLKNFHIPGLGQEMITSRDPYLVELLDTLDHLPNSLEADSNQQTINPNMLTRDPYLVGLLDTLDHLPNSMEADSNQQTIDPNMFSTDPYLVGLLDTLDHLPNSLELDSNQQTIDPNISGLGAVGRLPQVLGVETGNVMNLPSLGDVQYETSARIEIMV